MMSHIETPVGPLPIKGGAYLLGTFIELMANNNKSILSVVRRVASDLMEDISICLFIPVFLLCLLHMEAERRWGRRKEPSP